MKIDELLTYALDSGASDLHLSTGSIPMVRMNGIMKPLNMEAITEGEINDIMPQVMNDDQIKNFRNVKEIDFSYRIDGKGRFRVNFFEQIRGISCVFRAIPEVPKNFEELGIPPIMSTLSMKNRGLILLTGPTGSGKSTTLAAMVDHINQNRHCHIITVEDPVEYFHHSNQNPDSLYQSIHIHHTIHNLLVQNLSKD